MPINLAGGGRAGGVGDALLEIVKQRLLEQELNQRQQDQELRRRREDRMDTRQADQDAYTRGRDKEAKERQDRLDQEAAGQRTHANQIADFNVLNKGDIPQAQLNASLGEDPTTAHAVPTSTPGNLPSGSGQSFRLPAVPMQSNTMPVGKLQLRPMSMEANNERAAEDERRRLENDIARAKATQQPRVVDPGSMAEFSDPKTTPQRKAQIEADRKRYMQSDDRPLPMLRILTTDAEGNAGTLVKPRGDSEGFYPAQPTSEQRNRQAASKRSNGVLSSIAELSERINTGQGIVAKMVGGVEKIKAQANLNDDVSEYQALVGMFTPLLARAVGHTGVLTQQDVDSVKSGLPQPGDSKSVRDRKMARIDKIMAGMSGPAAADTTIPSGGKVDINSILDEVLSGKKGGG